VCNDGVTIAKEFELKDPEENLGARMLRQTAERTGELVDDGTSTSTVLAHAILADGLRNVVAGASAIDVKRGLDRAAKVAVDALRQMSKPVSTAKEKAQVAAISAHNDEAIGKMVAETMEKVGDEGVITVEESKTTETILDVVEDMQFDRENGGGCSLTTSSGSSCWRRSRMSPTTNDGLSKAQVIGRSSGVTRPMRTSRAYCRNSPVSFRS
jgi:chaperonin GroEL